MNPDAFLQILIVHFPGMTAPNHDIARVLQPQYLTHAIMRILGKIDNTVRIEFSGEIETVHVPFRPAIGDVTPAVFSLDPRQAGKGHDHLAFEVMGVHAEVAAGKGIAQIVHGEFHEAKQRGVIELLIARIADGDLPFGCQSLIERIQPRRTAFIQNGGMRDRVRNSRFRGHSVLYFSFASCLLSTLTIRRD